ncbi:MAG: hypothetical protein K2K21_07680 [Lachnospiraceae bacterium]|nr:hypothetical protein [Lachnospiraceae bacterium]
MIYKRTWLSNLLWAVYTCAAGVLLAIYAVLFWKNEIGTGTVYYMIAFVALVLVLIIACCLLINKVASKLRNKYRISRRAAIIWEIIAVFCICGAGLFYRFELYMNNGMGLTEATEYYLAASGNIRENVELILHGASYLYILCLSLILSFFEDAAVWLQIFIQMVTLLLAYFTVKKMAGRIAAGITMLMLAISSVYANQIFNIGPESLFFALYLIGMLTVGSYVKSCCRGRLSAITAICGAVFSGIVIGTLTYLDAVSVTLLILLPGLITGVRKIKEDNEKNKSLTTKFAFFLTIITVLTAGLTVMGAFGLDAYASRLAYREITEAWLELYRSHLQIDYMLYQTEYSLIECYVKVIIAVFLVISFWNTEKTQNATPWIVLMLLIAPTPLARMGVLPYQVFSIFIWSVLAGIGLQQSCILDVKLTTETTGAEETQNIAEVTDSSAVTTAVTEKPRFIENPLPLPKKHEKREMDFQYEVPENKMKFDIDIKDGDDFDI